jgi:GTP pyrophosphokinase
MLMRRLKNWKIAYGDSVIQKLIDHYNLKTAQDLYCNIESGKTDLLQIKEILQKTDEVQDSVQLPELAEKESREIIGSQYSDYLIIEDRIEGLDYKLAKCCNPVFGDNIFGFVTISEGIKIHRTGCPNAHNLISRYPYRVVVARWTKAKGAPSFNAVIRITGVEDIGIGNKIADILANYNVSVRNFSYGMDEGMFQGTLSIMVPNNDVLYGIIRKISSIKGVIKALRQKSG